MAHQEHLHWVVSGNNLTLISSSLKKVLVLGANNLAFISSSFTKGLGFAEFGSAASLILPPARPEKKRRRSQPPRKRNRREHDSTPGEYARISTSFTSWKTY